VRGEEERGEVGAEEDEDVKDRAAEGRSGAGIHVRRGQPCDGHGARSSLRVLGRSGRNKGPGGRAKIAPTSTETGSPEPVGGAGEYRLPSGVFSTRCLGSSPVLLGVGARLAG